MLGTTNGEHILFPNSSAHFVIDWVGQVVIIWSSALYPLKLLRVSGIESLLPLAVCASLLPPTVFQRFLMYIALLTLPETVILTSIFIPILATKN